MGERPSSAATLLRIGLSMNKAGPTTIRFVIALTTKTMCRLHVLALITLASGTRDADAPLVAKAQITACTELCSDFKIKRYSFLFASESIRSTYWKSVSRSELKSRTNSALINSQVEPLFSACRTRSLKARRRRSI